MRTIGAFTGLKGLALIAVIIGSAACTADGGTTIVANGTSGAPGATDPNGDPTTSDTNPTDPSSNGDPTSKDTPAPPLVAGVAITDVAVFQAVKVPVLTGGKIIAKASRNAPVVSNRPALVRVYVSPSAAYKGTSVTAELRLVDGTTRLPTIKDTKTVSGDSTDDDTTSTFNFEVPATSLPPGVTYQVLLTATGGTVPKGADDARFPKDGGVQTLDTEASGTLKIVIVPVKYMADGSGRVPDTSAAQLDLYKKTFMARYPASEVTVTARAPWNYTSGIMANGQGFSQVLNAVTQLRQQDQAGSDVYYYGALAPASTFNSFCQGGCVTGLSTVVDSPQMASLRASVGVGFTGGDSANTAAHEVGHAHGRNHAPCGGAQGVDASFPYSGGAIGVWGYDIFAKTFLSPTKGKDMMGYCPNEWVSDYTYSALFDRIARVNGGQVSAGSSGGSFQASTWTTPKTYRTATVEADGTVAWGADISVEQEPTGGDARIATFLSVTGETIGTHTARFYPYDHLPGGVLVVPSAPAANVGAAASKLQVSPTWSKVRISGLSAALTR